MVLAVDKREDNVVYNSAVSRMTEKVSRLAKRPRKKDFKES